MGDVRVGSHPAGPRDAAAASRMSGRLVLVGGGHAHLGVLADWIRRGPPPAETILVTPARVALYSGMVPGWIAGRYTASDAGIDLQPLCARAGVQLLLARAIQLDPVARRLGLGDGSEIGWDFLSIATGSTPRLPPGAGDGSTVLAVRPIERLMAEIAEIPSADAMAVLGGGAAGVELAFALDAAGHRPVTLVTRDNGLLPAFAAGVRRRAEDALRERGIAIVAADGEMRDDGPLCAAGRMIEARRVIAAIGSGAPDWLTNSGLARDPAGFIRVDAAQRSLSHPRIYAAGDVARRIDRALPPSGVHAVFAGPVLAANLRAAIDGRPPPRRYRPRRWTLYLLSTGDGRAILSWGPFAAQGRWVWWLKDRIDRRFIARFRRLAR